MTIKLPEMPKLDEPATLQVYCCVWNPDINRWHWHRVGGAYTHAMASAMIREDVEATKRTFGGLIGSSNTVRVYRTFKSKGFTLYEEDQYFT
jgi:hypothetical protein